jgi:hypothetical protein
MPATPLGWALPLNVVSPVLVLVVLVLVVLKLVVLIKASRFGVRRRQNTVIKALVIEECSCA